ncbi:MAG: 50S ribosomal protein L9 [Paludibacteraceae bacterium]|nr:50S ribosomal protein L9 [Paludibacteraceae bacterium]
MEVILLQDIDTLGYKSDIVKVRDGYARNYLIPQKLAIIANDSNKKQNAENLRQQARKLAQLLANAQDTATRLSTIVIRVAVKANEDGKIFGAVTTQQIADALKEQGFEIDRRVITIPEPIKQLGEGKAQARLHREVKADIRLEIVAAE